MNNGHVKAPLPEGSLDLPFFLHFGIGPLGYFLLEQLHPKADRAKLATKLLYHRFVIGDRIDFFLGRLDWFVDPLAFYFPATLALRTQTHPPGYHLLGRPFTDHIGPCA